MVQDNTSYYNTFGPDLEMADYINYGSNTLSQHPLGMNSEDHWAEQGGQGDFEGFFGLTEEGLYSTPHDSAYIESTAASDFPVAQHSLPDDIASLAGTYQALPNVTDSSGFTHQLPFQFEGSQASLGHGLPFNAQDVGEMASGPESHFTRQLSLQNFGEADSAMFGRHLDTKVDWRAPEDNDTVPLTEQDRIRYVIKLLDAIQDLSEYKDSDIAPFFVNRWGEEARHPFVVDQMEHVCWKLLEIAERLHNWGPATLLIYDFESLVKVGKSARWTFAERIDNMCYLLRTSKYRCFQLMKNNGFAMAVGAPILATEGIAKRHRNRTGEAVDETAS